MTTMYVNLNNIKQNLDKIRKILNKNTTIIAMVKADAYGLGDVEVAKFLEENGVNFFGVACLEEAIRLRNNDILSDIIVTGQFLEEDIENIVKYNITVSVSSLNFLNKLNEVAKLSDKVINMHLKVDTGMSRLGFSLNDLENNISKLLDFSNLCIDGIYTHLSSADTDKDYTLNQISKFNEAVDMITSLGIEPSYIHCLNSSGILNFPEYQFNTVRVGDILYGYYPDESLENKISLMPSVKIVSKISHISYLEKGTKISYSGTYTLKRPSKIAVVQMGYADGLFRNLSNKYEVSINGNKCKIVGNICMDMFMCDITDIKDVSVGDAVLILGDDSDIYTMSNIAGTINYEILTKISKRVKREYIK